MSLLQTVLTRIQSEAEARTKTALQCAGQIHLVEALARSINNELAKDEGPQFMVEPTVLIEQICGHPEKPVAVVTYICVRQHHERVEAALEALGLEVIATKDNLLKSPWKRRLQVFLKGFDDMSVDFLSEPSLSESRLAA